MKLTITQHIKHGLQDSLATFKWFERFFAIFCITIPLILRLTDKCENGGYYQGWRESISDYVYMWHNYVFGMLLGMAAMLFIFNGAVYFRNEDKQRLDLDKSGKWYNIVLGTCLLGVLVLPWKQHEIIHFIFAGTFFAGNALVTIIFHKKQHRYWNVIFGILTVVALAMHFTPWFPWLTLFWAEWVSLTVVGIHFFIEAL